MLFEQRIQGRCVLLLLSYFDMGCVRAYLAMAIFPVIQLIRHHYRLLETLLWPDYSCQLFQSSSMLIQELVIIIVIRQCMIRCGHFAIGYGMVIICPTGEVIIRSQTYSFLVPSCMDMLMVDIGSNG